MSACVVGNGQQYRYTAADYTPSTSAQFRVRAGMTAIYNNPAKRAYLQFRLYYDASAHALSTSLE